ncbi:MAG: hypothetical protein HC837_18120 [Chloroflexaceae bacterium]|nr:hypothetical protein [Chloroflexaceae bacterium]
MLRRRSFPIDEGDMLWKMHLSTALAERFEREDVHQMLNVAQIYAALRDLFEYPGSLRLFDDYKCSFMFPFFVAGTYQEYDLRYVLRVGDFRGSFEMMFYKIVDPNDVPEGIDRDVIRKPFADFPREAMDIVIVAFYSLLEGYLSVICKRPLQPFVHHIDSNFILFGYLDGQFFMDHYEDEDTYHAAVKAFKQRC